MKHTTETSFQELTHDELSQVSGGSEFTEDVFRGIGWIVGGLKAMGESFMNHQIRMENAGYVPRI